METLLRRKRQILNNLQQIKEVVDGLTGEDSSLDEVNVYLEKIEKIDKDLEANQTLVSNEFDDENYELVAEDYCQGFRSIGEVQVKLKKLRRTFNNGPGGRANAPAFTDVKLPKLELPTFSGDPFEWLSFHDLFTASIHNNASLKGAQKMQYLVSSCEGQALDMIKSFTISDGNYDEAWDILKARYQNTRELVNSILRKFCSQGQLKDEDGLALRKLIDTSLECTRSLKILRMPIIHWDAILCHIIVEKLDPESRRQWELSLTDDEVQPLDELIKFLEKRSRALTVTEPAKSKSSGSKSGNDPKGKNATSNHGSVSKCSYCKKDHFIISCQTFQKLSISERKKACMDKHMCFNCLKLGHSANKCNNATMCKKCGKRHHTMIHEDSSVSKPTQVSETKPKEETTAHHSVGDDSQVLLGTAILLVEDQTGKLQECRALLDSGSQASFMTEECILKLGLKRKKSQLSISGLGSSQVGSVRGQSVIQMHSCYDQDFSCKSTMYILNQVTKDLPTSSFPRKNWQHIRSLKLADPHYNTSRPVDILLGSDVLPRIVRKGVEAPKYGPMAQETAFGWVLSGGIHASNAICAYPVTLEELVKRFWEVEEIPAKTFLTPEEQACEDYFRETTTRDETGRYIVRLPFKSELVRPLGNSRIMASLRQRSQERRLLTDPGKREEYCKFMREYLDLGHMRQVERTYDLYPNNYYLPHHAVLKETSTTTKLRVVFDASAKTSSGNSLNDLLMVGPKTQQDLVQILIRFRMRIIALIGDIEKMYRQILMHSDDTAYQLIIWRESPDDPERDYELLTVTYGEASAPWLATRTLKQLAEDEKGNHPVASEVLMTDFYVDDLLSGESTPEKTIALKEDLTRLLQRGGFNIRKWASNDSSVVSHGNDADAPLNISQDDPIMTLGLRWIPKQDVFTFKVKPPEKTLATKRNILSEIAKIYDPMGWLTPTIIKAKIILQSLWKLNLTWDDFLPEHVEKEWKNFQIHLPSLEKVRIPRCCNSLEAENFELHGFCDSSESAYAAVVYARTLGEKPKVTIVAAKSKVAPIKQVSLPRLELCGAVLLVKLLKLILSSLPSPPIATRCWTDSTVVLAWLASSPSRWSTFVANRVSEVQSSFPREFWQHVRSKDNPADCASRGVSPSELHNLTIWWSGPHWLGNKKIKLSDTSADQPDTTIEQRKKVCTHVTLSESMWIPERFSSWNFLLRVTSQIHRFCHNSLKKNKTNKLVGPITPGELTNAMTTWIKIIQQQYFVNEINDLQAGRVLGKKSHLITLAPFLDQSGLLRVGGRLHAARLSSDRKFPILIPSKGIITDLIVRTEHLRLLHAGPQLLLSSLSMRFWILRGRDVCKRISHKCTICVRLKANTQTQIMGSLPSARINPSRAFLQSGVDFAGPFLMRVLKGRGQKMYKAYVALFICFSTRAIHLELVSDLTTGAFLASLERFVSRRGKPQVIHSDCGSNFVGSRREMDEFMQLVRTRPHNDKVAAALAQDGISWKLNPPAAPHFGGLWEAGVKSVKYHLKRTMGNEHFNYEEMITVLCKMEACLNSRPLSPMSSDPSDLAALTPGHFLIGDSLVAVPGENLTDVPANRLSRWQLLQQTVQHFWKRWSGEYLTRLQQRPKWWTPKADVTEGALVLIKDNNLPPLKWKMGRIIQLHPGPDDHVRVVTLKTADGELKRPVTKLSLLPLESTNVNEEE